MVDNWTTYTASDFSQGGSAQPDATSSAYTVEIGDFVMNRVAGIYPDENNEHSGLGQPNPTRITWSKTNEVATHKIPDPKWKTMRTSKETLWSLDLEFIILTLENKDLIISIVNDCGPHFVRTYFTSMYMYIQSFSANADAGYSDSRWNCSMKLIEVND